MSRSPSVPAGQDGPKWEDRESPEEWPGGGVPGRELRVGGVREQGTGSVDCDLSRTPREGSTPVPKKKTSRDLGGAIDIHKSRREAPGVSTPVVPLLHSVTVRQSSFTGLRNP